MRIRKFALTVVIAYLPISSYGGAWGVGSFENDRALDWVFELESASSFDVLHTAFESASNVDYIDADVCAAAVAAADVVASIHSKSFDNLPDEVQKWAKTHTQKLDHQLVSSALNAITQCTDQTKSELAQLWLESAPEEWLANISKLTVRLK